MKKAQRKELNRLQSDELGKIKRKQYFPQFFVVFINKILRKLITIFNVINNPNRYESG